MSTKPGNPPGVGRTVNSIEIEDDIIIDADINSAAAIALSKLASTGDFGSAVTIGGAQILTPESTSELTNKTFDADATGNSLSNVDLSADVTGDLPVTNLNGGTGASASTYFRGDGTWVDPGTGIASLVEDLTPQLGGDLDMNSKNITAAGPTTISPTEMSYLDGVSSNLQTQLDAKISADGVVTTHSDVTDAGSGAIITATERTKLSGIETLATVDQSDAEIKTAYENNADTNEFSDAEQTKLAAIEAAADITDATNVDAAGAVMNSDASTAAMSMVIDEDNMVSDSATKVPTQQSVKKYVDDNSGGSAPTIKTKGSDESVTSSTTLQADDDLTLAVTSGDTWLFQLTLYVSEITGNPNMKLRMGAGGSLAGTIEYAYDSPSGNEKGVISDFTTDTGTIALGTAKQELRINGTITATATGTLQLEWAQFTSDTDAAIVHALSSLIAWKK